MYFHQPEIGNYSAVRNSFFLKHERQSANSISTHSHSLHYIFTFSIISLTNHSLTLCLSRYFFLQWLRRSLTLPTSPCSEARTTTTTTPPFQLLHRTLSLLLLGISCDWATTTELEDVRGALEFHAPPRRLWMTRSQRRKSKRWRNVEFLESVSFAVVPRRSVEFRLTLRDRFSIIFRFFFFFFGLIIYLFIFRLVPKKLAEKEERETNSCLNRPY